MFGGLCCVAGPEWRLCWMPDRGADKAVIYSAVRIITSQPPQFITDKPVFTAQSATPRYQIHFSLK